MDGENNGSKPLSKWMIWGETPLFYTVFGNTHISMPGWKIIQESFQKRVGNVDKIGEVGCKDLWIYYLFLNI